MKLPPTRGGEQDETASYQGGEHFAVARCYIPRDCQKLETNNLLTKKHFCAQPRADFICLVSSKPTLWEGFPVAGASILAD